MRPEGCGAVYHQPSSSDSTSERRSVSRGSASSDTWRAVSRSPVCRRAPHRTATAAARPVASITQRQRTARPP